jgi:hypothetical protein
MADNTLIISATHVPSENKRRSYITILLLGSAGAVTLGWMSLIGWTALKVFSL